MAVAWPSYLPIALRAGYDVQAADVVARTAFEHGPVRLRRIAPPGPEAITVSWVMRDAQQQIFRAFWVYELASGAALVDMPIRTDGGGMQVQTVNFIGAPRYELKGVQHWLISVGVQVRRPSVIEADLYAIALANGGPALLDNTQLLYRIVNQQRHFG